MDFPGSPVVKIGGERHKQFQTGTGEFAGNYQGTGKPAPQANMARQMPNQSMGKTVAGAASPASNPGATNTEVQNDDQLLPYAKL